MKVSVRETWQTKFNVGDYFKNEYGTVRRIVRANVNEGYSAYSVENGITYYDESTIADLLMKYTEVTKVKPVEIVGDEIIFE